MIIGVEGNQGDGKTLLMTWLAWWFHNKGKKIHANYWLDIPGCDSHYVTTIKDIDKIYSGFFFADEFWSWIDSRGSGFNDINQAVTGIIMKARKRGYSLVFEAKRMHMADRRIRELADYVLKPNIYYNNNGNLEIIKQSLLNPVDLTPFIPDLWVVAYQYRPISETQYEIMSEPPISFRMIDFMNMYDTHEEICSLKDGENSPGIEKGMRKENHFMHHIKSILDDAVIIRNGNSRGIDLLLDNYPLAFDCVTPEKHKDTYHIDLRGKKIPELIADARKRNKKIYFLWKNGDYNALEMTEAHIGRTSIACSQGVKLKGLLDGVKTRAL